MAGQGQTQEPEQPVELEAVREGSRWINARPPAEEVIEWFLANAPVDDKLSAADYVNGVVLIGAKEKYTVTLTKPNGDPMFVERERYTYTPYVKVETRVAYFYDLMGAHPEWLGMIEAVPKLQTDAAGYANTNLPEGFVRYPVQKAAPPAGGQGEFVHHIACTMQVKIYRAETMRYDAEGRLTGIPARVFAAGTKVAPMLDRFGVDVNAIARCETGAIGRALGFAGMLVLPGSGVASAEDMQEVRASDVASPSDAPALPGATALEDEVDVRDRLATEIATMMTENPDGYERLSEWAKGRDIDLDAIPEATLRGVAMQVTRIKEGR